MYQKHGVSTLYIVHGWQHVRGIGAGNFVRGIVVVNQLLTVLINSHVAVAELQHVRLRTVEHVGNKAGFFIAVFGSRRKAGAWPADNTALHYHHRVFDNLRAVGVAGNINAAHQAWGNFASCKIGFYEVRAHIRTSTHKLGSRPVLPAGLPAHRRLLPA